MEIGRLKHRIKIFNRTTEINDEGTYQTITQLVAAPFCEVSKTTIKEFKEMGLDARSDTINFIIRYHQRVDIDSGMLVEFKGKELSLIHI